MEKETTFIMGIKEFIKETGKMEKSKVLDSLSLMINTDTQGSGDRIKKMERVLIFIQMGKDMKGLG